MSMRNLVLAMVGCTLLAAPAVQSADAMPDVAQSAPEVQIERAFLDAQLGSTLLMVVGNHIAWGGDPALLVGDWLGLACAADCALVPARVVDRPPSEATGGLRILDFSVEAGDATSVRLWLAVDPQRPWLRAGPVARYPFAARTDTPGSFEFTVDTSAAGGAHLVPMLDSTPPDAPAHEETQMAFYLQLRESGRRQLLAGHLAACADVPLTDYLHWAGDLDRDGRGDYLLRVGDNGGEVRLFLSGDAAGESLVTLSGRAAFIGEEPECDY
jgi:hypothetical protein